MKMSGPRDRRRAGHRSLRTDWDGTWNKRIGVVLDWRRRRVSLGESGTG